MVSINHFTIKEKAIDHVPRFSTLPLHKALYNTYFIFMVRFLAEIKLAKTINDRTIRTVSNFIL